MVSGRAIELIAVDSHLVRIGFKTQNFIDLGLCIQVMS